MMIVAVMIVVVMIFVSVLMITMRMGNTKVMEEVINSVVISYSGVNCQSEGRKSPYDKIFQHLLLLIYNTPTKVRPWPSALKEHQVYQLIAARNWCWPRQPAAIWRGSCKLFGRARHQLLTFCDFPGEVDVTNNASERKLRPCVIQRKVTNGYRALWAAQAEADVRTTIDTARLKGANPFDVILATLA